jgi:DNA-binding response OmpR family regulator
VKKTKILFIDDDVDFYKANELLLKQAGYDVILAENGKKGLESTK